MEFKSCTQPWFEMQLRYNSTHSFCCFHYDLPFNNSSLDVGALWNGPVFKKTRSEILSNNPKGTRCAQCPFIAYYDTPLFLEIPDWVQGERRANWQQAIQHYQNGDTVIDSLPIKYFLFFGLACNLRCKMCDHPTRFNAGENAFFDPSALLANPRYMASTSKVDIIGGEPFLIPPAVKFIDTLTSRPDTHDIDISVYTNGMLLDRFIERMTPLKRLTMVVSLDSHGKHFEAIRVRSSWDRIEKNIHNFMAHGKKNGKNWNTNIAVTVMKEGLLGYPELVQFAVDHNLSIHFAPVASHTADAHKQNIFANARLLEDVKGWEKALEDSVRRLKEAGRLPAAQQLDKMYQEFLENFHKQKQEPSANSKELQRIASFNSWEPILQGRDAGLVQNLQHNIYNGTTDQALKRNQEHIGLFPTNPRDHLASAFHPVTPSQESYVRLAIIWPQDASPDDYCMVELQDEGFKSIAPAISIDRNKGREKLMFFHLNNDKSHVRVILRPSSNHYSALPHAMMMDGHYGMSA